MLLFISFEPASGGHKIARTIASLPNVYWYSDPKNGLNPWNINSRSDVKGKEISRFHFNRITDWGEVPPPHDFVSDFFPDQKFYYDVIFKPRYEWIRKNIPDQYIIIPTHSKPVELRKHFPDCKIIQVTKPLNYTVERYLRTTANFPAYARNFDIIPENNVFLEELLWFGGKQWHHKLTKKDLWAFKSRGKMFDDSMWEVYETYIFNMIKDNYTHRIFSKQPDVLHFNNDWKEVKTYLNK